MRPLTGLLLLVLLLLAAPAAHSKEGTGVTADGEKQSGIDLTAMNPKVRPQDDFFRYVNGTWLDQTEIPADKSRYSVFNLLRDQTEEDLKVLIQEAAEAKAGPGSNRQKLGDMYNSYMDEERADSLGFTPIKDELKAISEVSDARQLAARIGNLQRIGVSAPFGFYVYPDAKKPDIYGFWLYQGGLSLPDRDYYLKDEEKFQKARTALQEYAEGVLTLVDHPESAAAAERILALETRLAKAHRTRVESRDAEKNYNKRSAAEVKKLLAGFDWEAYAQAVGAGDVEEMIVRNYPYFEVLGELFSSTEVTTWKDYFTFRLLDAYAPRLSADFVDRHFAFHSTALEGIPQNKPRWRRAVDATSGALGEVLGQEYVARHFTPQAKAKMEELVQNLIKAYGASIKELEWMSDTTKAKALEKLAAFKPKIGYPDEWRDYSALLIKADDLVGNTKRSRQFELDYELGRVGQKINPVDWGMTPQTVNAYYSPTRNEIVFPAAILQPPFFNLEADDAVNYGAIGGVIGHEIGHGFDDQGSKYDGQGNLRSWWTESDRTAFDALGDRFVAQYNQFSPIEGMSVNGRLTLGENIGDLAGIVIGYKAYKMSLEGEEAPVIDDFTGDQRFFMGWAQVWRGKIREDALRARLLSDPHSPAEYRVIGPLRNVTAFYEAFDVKEGDEMYLPPEERVKIW